MQRMDHHIIFIICHLSFYNLSFLVNSGNTNHVRGVENPIMSHTLGAFEHFQDPSAANSGTIVLLPVTSISARHLSILCPLSFPIVDPPGIHWHKGNECVFQRTEADHGKPQDLNH